MRQRRAATGSTACGYAVLDNDAATLIHREVHTLTGESRAVGFTDVNLVCHKLEDLLEVARDLPMGESVARR